MSNKLQIAAKVNTRYYFRVLTQMVIAIVLLSSCTRTIYQEREIVRHDSLYITSACVDTVIQRDSVRMLQEGDTVRIIETKYIYKLRERVDTCYKVRVDTVLKKEKVVEYKTEIVRKTDWGKCVWAFLIGAVAVVVMAVVRQFRE